MTTPASTIVAAANLTRTDGSARARGLAALFDNLSIGQNLKLQVIRQLDQQRYEVAFGGRRHVVESRVNLGAGTEIQARVEAKGDRLELRYLSTDARFADEEATEEEVALATPDADAAPAPPWLLDLAARYGVELDAAARETITRQATRAADRDLLTRGGLFLQKLAQEVAPRDLEALYGLLNAKTADVPAPSRAPIDLTNLPLGEDVAATLADALDAAAAHDAAVTAVGQDADADSGAEDDARRAQRLLNIQDEGSVAWRYGTLPLLVAGQLIELDLVMFREREQQQGRAGLKRLVMTLETTHFGRVQVEARAVDTRLIVKLRAPTADAVETMSAYGADVRAAIEQLGWAVDDIVYELDSQPQRAAHAVLDHVLSAGSVDREL